VSRSFLCGVGCHVVSRYFGICWIVQFLLVHGLGLLFFFTHFSVLCSWLYFPSYDDSLYVSCLLTHSWCIVTLILVECIEVQFFPLVLPLMYLNFLGWFSISFLAVARNVLWEIIVL
jgi:hypothetical protein